MTTILPGKSDSMDRKSYPDLEEILRDLERQSRRSNTVMEAKLTSSGKVDGGGGGDVECVKCECCGLTEECTAAYIAAVRESNQGRWICGLCTEAVKEEMERSCSEEALDRHMRFCKSFRSSMNSSNSPPLDLISAVKQILIRSLDSPRSPRSNSSESSTYHRSSSIVRSNGCHFSIDN
ncbi:hypothetical protein OSB04_014696 [Centaurea solstitialis]|uniref:Uncharacterized protein n=1 Tax=Centaurea solstitialis TaxID=347529 RepID=A0AA38TAZ7_9ASTR|nr:hypothetical protein OSB04_014696 [Centaurea solstitialis]